MVMKSCELCKEKDIFKWEMWTHTRICLTKVIQCSGCKIEATWKVMLATRHPTFGCWKNTEKTCECGTFTLSGCNWNMEEFLEHKQLCDQFKVPIILRCKYCRNKFGQIVYVALLRLLNAKRKS